MKNRVIEREQTREKLTRLLPCGATVYFALLNATETGRRAYAVFVAVHGHIENITDDVLELTRFHLWTSKSSMSGIDVGGDDYTAIVEALSFALYGDGDALQSKAWID